ncbi:MAG TPA: DUF624 domain-containing protein [Mobilitalea sp.]|nr:DUF624 domain-containing protein [Mobilitalea sp.]
MGLFSVDSPLYKFISRLWDMIVLNFLWLVFSIPIITIGASTVAAYSVALKMVDDEEGYIARSFVKAFKDNIRQGVVLGLIAMVAGYIVYINFALFNALDSNPLPLLLVGIVAGIYFLSSLLYAFPLAARYHNTIFQIMRNSRQICRKYFLRTIILVIFLVLMICAALWNNTTMVFGALIGPAFLIFLSSAFSKRIFQKIEKEQE